MRTGFAQSRMVGSNASSATFSFPTRPIQRETSLSSNSIRGARPWVSLSGGFLRAICRNKTRNAKRRVSCPAMRKRTCRRPRWNGSCATALISAPVTRWDYLSINVRTVATSGKLRRSGCSIVSVTAGSTGAKTVNVDLSKTSLARGRENFGLNGLATAEHSFIADDVLSVLPRLARKGEKFDGIILDSPTFSRSHRGNVFHVEEDFEKLLVAALEVAERNARILLSTNCSTLREHALEVLARYCLKVTRRAGIFHREPPPPDFPPGAAASTVWLTLR